MNKRTGAGQGTPPARHTAYWSLLYASFLFMGWWVPARQWLLPTLASLAIFLPVYLYAIRRAEGRDFLVVAAVLAALCYALAPWNLMANTYLIYAGALLPLAGIGLLRSLVAFVAAVVLLVVEVGFVVGWNWPWILLIGAITLIVGSAVCAANHFEREKDLGQAELKLSHDEVRRLGALAERERIGRDLHDLLGHTLSLIAIKAELARKLLARDPEAARQEIGEVERVAREALAQVRSAVTGIRAAGLAAELAAARLLLGAAGTELHHELALADLPAAIEHELALVVREAATNIQRHAQATQAEVGLTLAGGQVVLAIEDDGRGGRIVEGNGLAGMRERLATLGGELRIEPAPRGGTRLVASVPLPAAAMAVAAMAPTAATTLHDAGLAPGGAA